MRSVYSLRLRANEPKKVYWIAGAGPAAQEVRHHSGIDAGKMLYTPHNEWLDIYQSAFDGQLSVDTTAGFFSTDGYVTVVAPLRDPDNPAYIEGILGIDFNLDYWIREQNQIRLVSTQLLALVLALYLTALSCIALLHHNVLRISEAKQELVAAQKIAEVAARAKSDFLANMSHEIRTPMSAVVGFTEILAQRVYQNAGHAEREDLEGIMEIIRENGRLLLTIINDILDFSQIEANLLQVESFPVSIKQMLEEIWQMEMPHIVEKHLDFSVKYKEPIPELIMGDPTRLRQILINLVANAIKFTEKGSITIQCEASAVSYSAERSEIHDESGIRFDGRSGIHFRDAVPNEEKHGEDTAVGLAHSHQAPYPNSITLKIEIVDTGIGIEQEQMEYLFQPFTQLDNSSTRRFGGVGLGLSIAKRLAQLMDGDITVSSQPGVGSVFTFFIHAYLPSEHEHSGPPPTVDILPKGSRINPALEIRRPMPKEAEEDSTDVASQNRPLKGVRILLIEDMVVNQLVISTQLRDAGAMVEIAANGEQGIQKIVNDMDNGLFFDVVLMDMQMPVMDGYEATTSLRQQGYSAPIIAVTAHALSGDREKTIEAGCNDYIAKPVDRKILIKTIQKYLK